MSNYKIVSSMSVSCASTFMQRQREQLAKDSLRMLISFPSQKSILYPVLNHDFEGKQNPDRASLSKETPVTNVCLFSSMLPTGKSLDRFPLKLWLMDCGLWDGLVLKLMAPVPWPRE